MPTMAFPANCSYWQFPFSIIFWIMLIVLFLNYNIHIADKKKSDTSFSIAMILNTHCKIGVVHFCVQKWTVLRSRLGPDFFFWLMWTFSGFWGIMTKTFWAESQNRSTNWRNSRKPLAGHPDPTKKGPAPQFFLNQWAFQDFFFGGGGGIDFCLFFMYDVVESRCSP